MRQLPRRIQEVEDHTSSLLGPLVVDLLATALAERAGDGERVPAETRHRALVVRIRAHIEQRLADPGLSPATVAAAHHISVRTLHKLFAAEETTVSGLIRQRRLERCRRDLRDPALRGRPVSMIGARHGLINPAQFSRMFRLAYGVPPGEYRRAALG